MQDFSAGLVENPPTLLHPGQAHGEAGQGGIIRRQGRIQSQLSQAQKQGQEGRTIGSSRRNRPRRRKGHQRRRNKSRRRRRRKPAAAGHSPIVRHNAEGVPHGLGRAKYRAACGHSAQQYRL